jgi:hypothetical protein
LGTIYQKWEDFFIVMKRPHQQEVWQSWICEHLQICKEK